MCHRLVGTRYDQVRCSAPHLAQHFVDRDPALRLGQRRGREQGGDERRQQGADWVHA
jgi:hypothetical protein